MLTRSIARPFYTIGTAALFALSGCTADAPARRGAGTSPSALDPPNEAATAWAESTLAGLTLDKKIGQLIAPDITAGYIADDDPRLQRWIELARDQGVGMFVLYGGTPRDVAHLLNRLQGEAEIPILMAADFEGGPGQQVSGAAEYPPNMAFAAAGSEELVYRASAAAAVQGRAMGIHLTYTPDVDIAWRPENPAEAGRSFGGDLDLLGRLVHAYVRGYHENGMLTTAKHFPGRGDIELMPDNPPWTWIDKSAADVAAQEFSAFQHAVDAGVDFIMTEHIAVPSVADGSQLPASQEKKLATDVIRDQLGFDGILTTDDLWYDHVVARFGAEEVALRAFEAGHDIILKPRDPIATIAAMAEAVRSGRISEERIDRAVLKLLTLKARLGLQHNRFVDEYRVGDFVGTREQLALVQEVADRSLTMLENDQVIPVDPGRMSRAVNINIQKVDGDPAPAALSARLTSAFPGIQNFTIRPDADRTVYDEAWRAVAGSDLVILSLFVQRTRYVDATPIRREDLSLIQRIIDAKPGSVVAMAYGNPHLIREIPRVAAFLVGYGEQGWYGNQEVYFDSFIGALTGELSPSGKLPVRVSGRHPIGSGGAGS